MRQILVPLDGSKLSEAVLPWVEAIARATGAKVILFRVVGDDLKGEIAAWRMGQPVSQIEAYLADRAHALTAQGIKVEVAIGYEPASKAILNLASEKDVDLIAMGTRGRAGPTRLVFGSVARAVFDGTDRPLLIVRHKEAAETKRPVALEKILVPLDGSERSLSVLPFVVALARSSGASLVLLHVVPGFGIYPAPVAPIGQYPSAAARTAETINLLKEQVDDFLSGVSERIEAKGVETARVISIGFAADEIVRAATETDADLIALCSGGGAPHVPPTDVTQSVVRSARVPTLIVRPLPTGSVSEVASEVKGRRS